MPGSLNVVLCSFRSGKSLTNALPGVTKYKRVNNDISALFCRGGGAGLQRRMADLSVGGITMSETRCPALKPRQAIAPPGLRACGGAAEIKARRTGASGELKSVFWISYPLPQQG